MATLALSTAFLDDYSKLETRIRARVSELADKFRQMTAQQLRASKGIHLEPHQGARDPRARTIRITDNHRGIVLDTGNAETYVLTRIGTHDETDRWMAKNEFRVNEATGALEVLDVEGIAEQAAMAPEPVPDERRLYEHRADKEFTKLGIAADLVPTLRVFTDEDQLSGLLGVMPQTQADALILLVGEESVDELYQQVAGDLVVDEIDPEDLSAAVLAPASKGQFHVVTDEDDLVDVLTWPLARWRTYLHHSQEEIAYESVYDGPVRVTGGPGTGKTVVAMHRAAALARLVDPAVSGKPILFTTFTRNLAEAIERDLRLLGGTQLLDVVEVLNVDRLAHRVVTEAEGEQAVPADDDEPREILQQIIDETGSDHSADFLVNEWEQVILAQGCSSRSEYFEAARVGRGVRLDRRDRAKVWKIIEQLSQELVDRNKRSYLQIAEAAAGYLEARSVKPYQHVVVDEGQDLHEAQLRLLRAAVEPQSNDLFLVGDSHQRIYDRNSTLSGAGIDIGDRGFRLRINYRTTHEILGWALALLGEAEFDDLDTGIETDDLAGYHSFLHGPVPTMSANGSQKAQFEALVEQIRTWIDQGVAPSAIAVSARTKTSFEAAEHALDSAGIPTVPLGRELGNGDGVAVGTMHRMKGLEFRCVAAFDVDDDRMPAQWDLTDRQADEAQREADLRRERCVLYVACTRAREDLWVGWSGKPSRFLERLLRTS